jgi:hypothetical protein
MEEVKAAVREITKNIMVQKRKTLYPAATAAGHFGIPITNAIEAYCKTHNQDTEDYLAIIYLILTTPDGGLVFNHLKTHVDFVHELCKMIHHRYLPPEVDNVAIFSSAIMSDNGRCPRLSKDKLEKWKQSMDGTSPADRDKPKAAYEYELKQFEENWSETVKVAAPVQKSTVELLGIANMAFPVSMRLTLLFEHEYLEFKGITELEFSKQMVKLFTDYRSTIKEMSDDIDDKVVKANAFNKILRPLNEARSNDLDYYNALKPALKFLVDNATSPENRQKAEKLIASVTFLKAPEQGKSKKQDAGATPPAPVQAPVPAPPPPPPTAQAQAPVPAPPPIPVKNNTP